MRSFTNVTPQIVPTRGKEESILHTKFDVKELHTFLFLHAI